MARLVSAEASAEAPCSGRSLDTISVGPTTEVGTVVVSEAIVGKTSVAPGVGGGADAGATAVVTVDMGPAVVVDTGFVDIGFVDIGFVDTGFVGAVAVAVARGGCVDGELVVVLPVSRKTNAATTVIAKAVATTAAVIHTPRLWGGRCSDMTVGAGGNAGPAATFIGGTIGVPTGGDVTPPHPPHRASPATMIRSHHIQLAGVATGTECSDAVEVG